MTSNVYMWLGYELINYYRTYLLVNEFSSGLVSSDVTDSKDESRPKDGGPVANLCNDLDTMPEHTMGPTALPLVGLLIVERTISRAVGCTDPTAMSITGLIARVIPEKMGGDLC